MKLQITLFFTFFFSLSSLKAQDVETIFNQAITSYQNGNVTEAIAYIDQCLAIDSNLAGVWYNRGLFNSKLSEFETAIKDFEKAISIVPSYAKAYNMRGNCYQDIEQYEKALIDYTAALNYEESNLDAMWNMAETYLKMEDNYMACSFFQKAADLGDEESKERLSYYQKNGLVNDPNLVLSDISNDKTYGYSSDNPIMVGRNIYTGPQSERVFLDQLRDARGNQVEYNRVESCCGYDSENGLMGIAMLDVYKIDFVNAKGKKETVQIYISMYDFEALSAPFGFFLAE